uniref:Uncharacterized protein n=1 Tax=Nelumbo nucifera TaxID=4432 RepID=A0A822YQH8_NELNU|nr:TPA_asm: hypothetical protein HUJ06_011927 [Nelumbo nucifera]
MARTPSSDIDDDFNEIYKEYTGPPVSNATSVQDKTKGNKRPQVSSDEEEEPRDPNAVPTDFTSREAKVWEAKSKATERNWKKRKEEEMICKICGESGHFTQAIRELRENYMKKLVIQRGMHAKQWEEFLEFDVQRRQRARQHMSASGFGSYNHPGYSDYDRPSGNLSYTGANIPIDSRGRYPYPLENYPTRPHDTYGEFQRQRHEDFGKAYNRY